MKGKTNTIHDIIFHNTLTKKDDVFTSIEQNKVRMYNCGPTVYNEPHIGNLRSYIFADTLRRTLEYNDYEVHQVINITDVGHLVADSEDGEDKMEKMAKETGETAQEIAGRITNIFFKNLSNLGINTKQIEFPHATNYIKEQIDLIKILIKNDYAYQISRGIAFNIKKFKEYGKLGNINIDNLKAGARIEEDSEKLHHADFWLWKFSSDNDKRQQEWDSPWGKGFPGWHIECSAMSKSILGNHFDIHTGGIDHIPIHHNNEIAQSEAANNEKFVNYWMHNAHLMFDGKRFEKSSGHVIYLRQLIDKGYNPLALRYLLLTSKYSVEQNFTWKALDAAQTALSKIKKYYSEHLSNEKIGIIDQEYKTNFKNAINDDLSTPKALALLWQLVKDDTISKENKKATILDFDTVLGLQISDISDTKIKSGTQNISSKVQDLLIARKIAREEKNWVKSDEIRDELKKCGYTVVDKDGEQELSTTN